MDVVTTGGRTARICAAVGVVLMAAGIFHLGVFLVDGGPWEGPVSWRKPATFGLSFGLTLLTVVWLASLLPLGSTARAWLLGLFAADSVVEVGGITLQAWRGVPSHVNMEGGANTTVSMVLAAGGGLLIVLLGWMAVAAFRGSPAAAPSMRLALRYGFASLMIGLLSGAAMIARGVPEARGGEQQRAYHDVGFLKAVHGVSLHGVLVLPALAWVLSRLDLPEERRTAWVRAGVAVYAVAIAGALVVSLAGV
ncbi:hypothetical protein [Actinocorallia longicatena]|uniref:DUF5134 domain-containing protein n=1 Tax=Actinocorallia longicatena TaxID=111803 RepID=A0ABP6Q8N0_9ACTN